MTGRHGAATATAALKRCSYDTTDIFTDKNTRSILKFKDVRLVVVVGNLQLSGSFLLCLTFSGEEKKKNIQKLRL